MARFIIVSFIFLGWAFYEMSGGADFDPIETREARIDAPVLVEEDKLETVIAIAATQPVPDNVTRVALNLTSVNDVLRPAPTLRTEVAKVTPAIEAAVTEALSEEEPTIILPSLVAGEAVITPVEFGRNAQVATDNETRRVTGNSVTMRGGPGTG